MALAPINYALGNESVLDQVLKGYSTAFQANNADRAASLRERALAEQVAGRASDEAFREKAFETNTAFAERQADLADQKFGLEQREFGLREQMMRQQAAAQQAAVAAAQRNEQRLAQGRQIAGQLLNNPNTSPEDWQQFYLYFPEFQTSLSKGMENIDDARKTDLVRGMGEVSAALSSGNEDIAKKMLNERKAAYLAANDKRGAGAVDSVLTILSEAGPVAASNVLKAQIMAIAPDVGKIMFGGEKGDTSAIQNYKFATEVLNMPPEQAANFGKSGTTVNVNQGDGDTLKKKLDEKTADIWAKFLEAGTAAATQGLQMEQLTRLAQIAPTGPFAGQFLSFFPQFNDAAAGFTSIVKALAPTFRVEGTGATSDMEFTAMLQSLPRLVNNEKANLLIIEMLKAKAKLNIERAKIVTDFNTGRLSKAEAFDKMQVFMSKSVMSPELTRMMNDLEGAPTPSGAGSAPASGVTDWQSLYPVKPK